jgi:hypothetical protein
MPLRTQPGEARSSFPALQLVVASSIVFHPYLISPLPRELSARDSPVSGEPSSVSLLQSAFFCFGTGCGIQCLVIKECECQIGTNALSPLARLSLSPRAIQWHAAPIPPGIKYEDTSINTSHLMRAWSSFQGNVESRDENGDPEPLIERSAKRFSKIKSLEITHALLSGSIAAWPPKDGHMRSENIRTRFP